MKVVRSREDTVVLDSNTELFEPERAAFASLYPMEDLSCLKAEGKNSVISSTASATKCGER